MKSVSRREQIVDYLYKHGTVSVNRLSEMFQVSTVTIRTDLRLLELQGCLLRSYGGAVLNEKFTLDRPLQDKSRINFRIKNRIAERAAALVNDGDRIILDSGSTTAQMVPYLREKRDLIVMTNALNIAYELATYTDIEVMVIGGNVRKKAYSICGPTVEQYLKMYCFDKLFLGVDGFDLNAGITTPNLDEAHLNRVMCEVSQHVIAVTDSSKFDRRSFCMISEVGDLDTLVTDQLIPAHYLQHLTALGVDVQCVELDD